LKILIVDNKDSFTYNLKHYIKQFTDNVDVLRYNNLFLDDVQIYDKILFSPGPGLPKEYPILESILKKYASYKSILGICLGHQAIVSFYGGILENLAIPMHGTTSQIEHLNSCSLFKNIPNYFQIGHYHSWIASKKRFPKELEVTSFNQNGIIMSLKHKKYDVKSVQFHPESILTENGLLLIQNWIMD
tara:strand:+ start:7367 stop:7930 length:564 start_codon:yes stop_codon:yes gene_type:complete